MTTGTGASLGFAGSCVTRSHTDTGTYKQQAGKTGHYKSFHKVISTQITTKNLDAYSLRPPGTCKFNIH
jgi:hypothetical protein